jgi:hypothetical protein
MKNVLLIGKFWLEALNAAVLGGQKIIFRKRPFYDTPANVDLVKNS